MNSQEQKFRVLPSASTSISQMMAQSDIEKGTININLKPFLKFVVFSNNLDR